MARYPIFSHWFYHLCVIINYSAKNIKNLCVRSIEELTNLCVHTNTRKVVIAWEPHHQDLLRTLGTFDRYVNKKLRSAYVAPSACMRICCLETALANAYKVCAYVLYAQFVLLFIVRTASMILFSSEVFVVLLLWLRHLLVTLSSAIVFKGTSHDVIFQTSLFSTLADIFAYL